MRCRLTWLCLRAEQACSGRDRHVVFFFLIYNWHTLLTFRTSFKTRRDAKAMPAGVRAKVTLVQSVAPQGKATSLQCISQKPEAKERSLHCVGGARNVNKHPETMWSATPNTLNTVSVQIRFRSSRTDTSEKLKSVLWCDRFMSWSTKHHLVILQLPQNKEHNSYVHIQLK